MIRICHICILQKSRLRKSINKSLQLRQQVHNGSWGVNKSMIEKIPNSNQERSRIRTEQEYIAMGVKYALSTGLVKEAQKDLLLEKYLKPIYRKYLEIIEELRKEKVPEDELAKIVLKMNNCLEATRRIGSTDPDNIVRSIQDSRDRAQDEYTEYALTSLLDFVSETIRS